MTTEQYITNLERKISALDNADLIFGAATATHQMQLNRIFDSGMKASGKIGAYAGTPMYADAAEFSNTAAFQPVGKARLMGTKARLAGTPTASNNRNTIAAPGQFKNGKPRKSMYLQNGYQQLKAVQGLEADFVNLSYSGDLRNDLTQNLVAADDGFTSGVTSATNAQKIAGLMARYGNDLFDLTDDEKQFFKTTVTRLVTATIR